MRSRKREIAIAITGASGIVYGIRLLEVLRGLPARVHLIVSRGAELVMRSEGPVDPSSVRSLADVVWDEDDLSAPISSGSYPFDGMVVVLYSIKTLSAISNSFNVNLIIRTADVALKKRRKLVLVVRETPIYGGHLELMLRAFRGRSHNTSPIPAFYHAPKTLDDIVNYTIGKILDVMGFGHSLYNN